MIKYLKITFVSALMMALVAGKACSDEVFDFEKGDTEGWVIPDWAMDQPDQVGRSVKITAEEKFKGENSLELACIFPGNKWASAVVEYDRDIDFSGYKKIVAHIYVPKKSRGEGFLQARIILVVGPWWWIEQRMPTPLNLGVWNRIEAKLDVTEADQMNFWKRKSQEGTLVNFRDQVKKVVVRIEYNASEKYAGVPYDGPIYIDDIEFNK